MYAPAPPQLCQGGSVTVTFTATDKCQTVTATSTYTVTPPTPLTVTAPAAKTVDACAIADQAALDTDFQAWLKGATAAGGCTPTAATPTATAPTLCTGGSVTVT